MRCTPGLALLLGLAFSVHAQRGGAARGGSFSGRPSFSGALRSGSFGASARPGFAPRPYAPGPRFAANSLRIASPYALGRPTARPLFYRRAGDSYGSGRTGAYPYGPRGNDGRVRFGYPRGTYLGYLSYGYPFPFYDSFLDPSWEDSFGSGNAGAPGHPSPSNAVQSPDSDAFGAIPHGPGEPSLGPNRQDAGVPWTSTPSKPAVPIAEEDAITLIFKDGQQAEQIRNYALTRTTLYVTGKHIREIPLDEIDLPATKRTNRAAGIDFQLPSPR